nr:hypothetical protein BaRGS_027933 [Batillaria attramentaria]
MIGTCLGSGQRLDTYFAGPGGTSVTVNKSLAVVATSGVDRFEEARKQRLLVLIACPLINSILDPLVYFWRLQDWRAVILGRFADHW